jgi:hypothetical protein
MFGPIPNGGYDTAYVPARMGAPGLTGEKFRSSVK